MMPSWLARTPLGIYVLREDTHLSRWVEQADRLDIDANIAEIASFAQYIPEGGVVIDAGACLGDHTVVYSQIVGPNGCVYACEPHPLTYEALVRNTARLRNVIAIPKGLSDRCAWGYLHPDRNVGASFLSSEGLSVSLVTLDRAFAHLDRCDFIHLDAEGLETAILSGGEMLIARFHPTLVVEICPSHLERAGSSEAELLALLDRLGYHISPIPGHDDPALRDVLAVWS